MGEITRLNLSGPNTVKELQRIATDAETQNALTITALSDQSATVEFNRTWRNGWGLTAYGKAWWNGDRVVGSAGVGVTKKMGD